MSGRRLRVAMIGSRGFPGQGGGVERVLESVTPRLVAADVAVSVYCAAYVDFVGDEYHGVELRRVRSLRTKYADTLTRSALAMVRELRGDADIIHLHGIGSAPLALLARLARRRSIVTIHGLDWKRSKWNALGRRFLRFGEWAAVRFPDATVVVSAQLEEELERRHGRPVVYIPNGAETRERVEPDIIRDRWGLGPDEYLLFLGRLVPEKGAHVLIEAFRQLPAEVTSRLVIAGPTWYEDEYNRHLRELAAGDERIVFTGEVDEPPLRELYSSCRAFVLPSEVEGMALSLLDAFAFGCCIVTSSIPENADLVGDAGLVFPTGDAVELSARLEAVLRDDEMVEDLRARARRRAGEEFDWNRIAEQWIALYEEVAAR